MGKIKVQYLPEIELFLNNLNTLLFEKEYFSFIEYANDYVENLTFYIENEISTIPHKTSPKPLKKFGSKYIFYKANNRTTWYIFFENKDNRYLITHITNNHLEEVKDL